MFIFPVLSALFYSISNVFSKITTKHFGIGQAVSIQSFSAGVFLCIIGLFFGFGNLDFKWFILTAILGIFSYIPLLFFLKGVAVGKMGILLPIKEGSVIFSILFTSFF
jgi:uncharacterized membrane protein